IANTPAAIAEAPAGSRAQPAATPTSNSELVRWMFQFAAPVKMLIFLACLYLALWVGAEVLAVRQTGQVVGHIQTIHRSDIGQKWLCRLGARRRCRCGFAAALHLHSGGADRRSLRAA